MGGKKDTKRYRPGRPFTFAPVWFLSAPERQSRAGILGELPAGPSTGRVARHGRPEAPVIAGELTSSSAAASSSVVAAGITRCPRPTAPTRPGTRGHRRPLTTRALLRVDEALRLADASTGLTFSVYIGDLGEASRDTAEHLLGQLIDPDRSVLIAISPNQRLLEIVTGSTAGSGSSTATPNWPPCPCPPPSPAATSAAA